MLKVRFTNQFKKDYKLALKRGCKEETFLEVLNKLLNQEPLPEKNKDHALNGTRSISADTALRLGKYFGTGPEFWMNLQDKYDLCNAAKETAQALKKFEQCVYA